MRDTPPTKRYSKKCSCEGHRKKSRCNAKLSRRPRQSVGVRRYLKVGCVLESMKHEYVAQFRNSPQILERQGKKSAGESSFDAKHDAGVECGIVDRIMS